MILHVENKLSGAGCDQTIYGPVTYMHPTSPFHPLTSQFSSPNHPNPSFTPFSSFPKHSVINPLHSQKGCLPCLEIISLIPGRDPEMTHLHGSHARCSAGAALGGTWTKPLFLGRPEFVFPPVSLTLCSSCFQWADGPQDGAGSSLTGHILSLCAKLHPISNKTTQQQHMRRR